MKLWWLWRKRENELDKEIAHHLRMAAEVRGERGALPRDAEAGARREFGNVALVRATARDAWGWRWLQDFFEDARYGYRTLSKNTGFTAIAILTLSLGIGANTAIFSLIDVALLRSLPVRDAGQLVLLKWHSRTEPQHLSYSSYGDCESSFQKPEPTGCSFSEPFFHQLQKTDIFSGLAAFAGTRGINLSGNGAASVVDRAEFVSGEYFETLGVKPALGRLISLDDDTAASPAVVVLSFLYWRSHFGGSKDVVGKTILLNRVPFAVVGVAEEKFDALSPGNIFDMWIPLVMASRIEQPWDNRDADTADWMLVMVGRLKPGVAVGSATAELTTLFQNETGRGGHSGLPMLKPEDGGAIDLSPLELGLTGSRKQTSAPLYLMMLVVGIVLLIACANVAGLMLARATSRQREMAVRFALGASKGRILRQLLTESLMLSAAGGVIGILFASWCLASILAFLQANTDGPMPFTPAIDTRVLLFTGTVAILTGVLFGLAPAFRGMRVDLTPALKQGAGSISRSARPSKGRFSAGNGLVVAQVALSIVVLAGAGLLVRTLQNLKNVNLGFDTRNILTFTMDPTLIGYKSAEINNFYGELKDRLSRMPGVTSVSYSWRPLLGGGLWTTGFHLAGKPKDEESDADLLPVGPEFFRTMRIPLQAGHEFNSADFARQHMLSEAQEAQRAANAAKLKLGAEPEAKKATAKDLPPTPAIVNQAFVRTYMPTVNPIGQVFGTEEADPAKGTEKSSGWEIVGVVGNAKYNKLRRDVQPTIYIPNSGRSASFVLRTETDPTRFIPQIRAVVNQMDSNLPVVRIRTETQQINQQIFKERLVARLSGFFGSLALLLACIGLYGLVSYDVARRTREIGIRAALGAEKRDVLRLVLNQGMWLALVGAAAGNALAFALTRYAKELLFGVKAADPMTFVWVTMLLLGVTLLACFVPARRAMRVDPVVALRYE